jgi:glycosyltransferase involved in cell wall biosynthesis
LAIRACNKLKEKLVIRGDGGERSYLQEIAGPTVTFTGPIDNRTKINYLKYAKGFIFPSIDEDFGIAPVEAMGYGVPVIAFYSGASRETITEWKTGLFFRTYSTASLINSLRTFSHIKFSQKDCHAQAKRFTAQKFKKNILHVVDTLCKE